MTINFLTRIFLVCSLFGFLEGCGEQQNITPAGGNSSEIANDVAKELTKEPTKEMTEQPGRAKLTQVSEAAPFQLFTFSQDKVTEDDLKILRPRFMFSEKVSKPRKINIDKAAVLQFLKLGGWVELPMKEAKSQKFFLVPAVNEVRISSAGSRPLEIGNWDSVSVSVNEIETNPEITTILIYVNLDYVEYRLTFHPRMGYVLYTLDAEKMPPLHGNEPYKPPVGGPPIPVPPKSTWPDDLKPSPPLKEKAVSAAINIRIGLMATTKAIAQSQAIGEPLFDKFTLAVKYLNEALAYSGVNVVFTFAGPVGAIGLTESNKPLLDLLNELNSPAVIRADVASFRLQKNVDIVVAAVASSSFLGGIAAGSNEGGYA
jgi:hypothetical protein